MTVKISRFLMIITGLMSFAVGGADAQNKDECIISALTSAVALKKLESSKPVEIGRIDISKVTEGTRYDGNIKIPGSTLYTYVEIVFDDDMSFHGDLYSAISVYLLISTSRIRNRKSTIGFAVSQSAYDEGFKQLDLTTSALNRERRSVINVLCRIKKPAESN